MRFERITINSQQMGGLPCIRGLRLPMTTILGQLAAGQSHAQILEDFPELVEADIYAALEFAAKPFTSGSFPSSGEAADRREPVVAGGCPVARRRP